MIIARSSAYAVVVYVMGDVLIFCVQYYPIGLYKQQVYKDMFSLRATSQTRWRVHDHCTSSTFVGGKGGAGPSSLHTMLEGPTKYVNAIWM